MVLVVYYGLVIPRLVEIRTIMIRLKSFCDGSDSVGDGGWVLFTVRGLDG
jgi:hypothetical protein